MGDTINMAAYARMLCGLDPMQPHEMLIKPESSENYPPYNIEKIDGHRFQMELAVAGFSEKELSVTVEGHRLTVAGKKAPANGKTIIYQEIIHRPFTRSFSLADYLVVKDTKLAHGLLIIEIERQSPEVVKPLPRTISGPTAAAHENPRAAA